MSTPQDWLTPRVVTHPRLSTETTWMAIGDLTLLEAEHFVPVILSRSLFADKLEREILRIEAAVRAGAVAVGGFISFPEKQAAKRLAAIPNLRLIRMLPQPLFNYPLTPAVEKRLREGKTLILSGIPGEDMTLTRANCVQNNGWISALCEAHSSPIPHTPIVVKSAFARPSKVKTTHQIVDPSEAHTKQVLPSLRCENTSSEDPAAIFL